jgi:hypothetical protein
MDIIDNKLTTFLLWISAICILGIAISSLNMKYWETTDKGIQEHSDMIEKTSEHQKTLQKHNLDGVDVYYYEDYMSEFNGDDFVTKGFVMMREPDKIFIKGDEFGIQKTLNHEIMHLKSRETLKWSMFLFTGIIFTNILNMSSKVKSNLDSIIALSIVGLTGCGGVILSEGITEFTVYVFQLVQNPGYVEFDSYFKKNILLTINGFMIFTIADIFEKKYL